MGGETSEPGDTSRLFDVEADVVAGAVHKRRREFAAVRVCARQALAQIGVGAGPIANGSAGEPLWPKGVVGSMTHCDGYAAAVVARATARSLSLGVDAEPEGPLPEGVLAAIALEVERDALDALHASRPDVCWDRLLFSVKESVYKVCYPLTRSWLDFHDAHVVFRPDADTFTVTMRTGVVPPEMLRLSGRWARGRGLLVSGIVHPTPTAETVATSAG